MSCDGGKPGSNKLQAPKRNRYYYGKLLDEFHLRMETQYQNEKRWLLNRLSLGNGVLCGLKVTAKEGVIQVSSGMAIDAWGREIIVPAQASLDPWKKPDYPCGEAESVDLSKPLFLCLTYRECLTDPMPALVTECGQDACEAGTIVEGYRLSICNMEPPEWPNQPPKELCEALKSSDVKARLEKLCENSQQTCSADDASLCVILARIELKDPSGNDKTIKVEDCTYRRYAYGNEILFEMIMCLAAQSGKNGLDGKDGANGKDGKDGLNGTNGVNGKNGIDGKNGVDGKDGANGKDGKNGRDGRDGLGLFPDLPKILDIAWIHQQPRYYLDQQSAPVFMAPFRDGDAWASDDVLIDRIRKGSDVPPFTIYFNQKLNGLDRHTFCLNFKVPIGTMGINLHLGVNGRILEIDNSAPPAALQTPHTGEGYAYAATFIPERRFFFLTLPRILQMLRFLESKLDQPQIATFHILLKGDFIWAGAPDKFAEDAVLDADNIGGRVGMNVSRQPPVKGGKNPSGNLTQGGDFESWFDLLTQEQTGLVSVVTNANVPQVSFNDLLGMGVERAPVNVNLASKDQLVETGFTEPQADKIIAARSTKWFTDPADVVRLIKLKPAVATEMQLKIIA